jgi:hypothetical protein
VQFLRFKIADKSTGLFQCNGHRTQHLTQLDNLKLPPNDLGYLLVVEGVMPYNTSEGQLVMDVATNQEDLTMTEIQ